jgi:hypothetical protein
VGLTTEWRGKIKDNYLLKRRNAKQLGFIESRDMTQIVGLRCKDDIDY